MSKKDKAVQWAVEIAKDNTHGYSQSVRWGPSYDCSSLVISAYEQAGVPVKTAGATYTGNMYPIFMQNGFVNVTGLVNLASGTGLEKGDVLLNTESHTALYIGNGQVVHARSSEGTCDTTDNSGQEIRTQSYWNYPWNYVLRLGEDDNGSETVTNNNTSTVVVDTRILPYNTVGLGVAMIQGGLEYLKYNLGWYGIDGDSGDENSYTNRALDQALAKNEIQEETIEYLKDIK